MRVLTALLRLRQACCDLRLLGHAGLHPQNSMPCSNSWRKRSMAVIARWSSANSPRCSTLLPPRLKRTGISFCRLDGSTKNRRGGRGPFPERRTNSCFPHQPQGGRRGTQSHRSRHRHSLRSMVEPRRRGPSHRPRPPNRPATRRHLDQTHCPRHRRRAGLADAEKKRELLEGTIDAETALERLSPEDLASWSKRIPEKPLQCAVGPE